MATAMTTDETRGVDSVLWLGALLFARGRLEDPFPAELEYVATLYFGVFPPLTKA
jgi:hypothetical protein